MNYYLKALQDYAKFSGRSGRREYWSFFLFNMIIMSGFGLVSFSLSRDIESVIDNAETLSKLYLFSRIFQLAILIPSIAVGVRRMHDIGKSGWFSIIPIYGLILACTKGNQEDNKYGVAPKEITIQSKEKSKGKTKENAEREHTKKTVNGMTHQDKINQLKELKELLDKGIFTQEEFESEKTKVLAN